MYVYLYISLSLYIYIYIHIFHDCLVLHRPRDVVEELVLHRDNTTNNANYDNSNSNYNNTTSVITILLLQLMPKITSNSKHMYYYDTH